MYPLKRTKVGITLVCDGLSRRQLNPITHAFGNLLDAILAIRYFRFSAKGASSPPERAVPTLAVYNFDESSFSLICADIPGAA